MLTFQWIRLDPNQLFRIQNFHTWISHFMFDRLIIHSENAGSHHKAQHASEVAFTSPTCNEIATQTANDKQRCSKPLQHAFLTAGHNSRPVFLPTSQRVPRVAPSNRQHQHLQEWLQGHALVKNQVSKDHLQGSNQLVLVHTMDISVC